jgi:peptidoglycan/xylan/chitin deacetylase (PgdA/CDA1 family)/CelD/BcsL family acetyltransferase involved in cellulose biosynthesis
VRIELLVSEKEWASLRQEWDMLVQSSAGDTIFLTWEWLASWWSAYNEHKRLFILVARDESGELRGVAPLYSERFGKIGRRLRFIGDGTHDSDYLDFIIARGHETVVLAGFFDQLKQLDEDWEALQLNEIPCTSPNLPLLRDLKKHDGWFLREENVPCGVGKLPGTWEEFLQELKPRFRTTVRACLRNLEQWKGTFEVLSKEDDISSWLQSLFELHSDRWSLRQQSGVFATREKRDFYDKMARSLLNRGWLHMTRWSLNGAVLSCQFGFVYEGIYHLLQEGFDTRSIHVSPGVTLRAATIRDLISRGVHTYDFLGGIGRHKTDWGAREKKSWRLAIAPRTAAGYAYVELPFALQTAKDKIKGALPGKAVSWWKGPKRKDQTSKLANLPASDAANGSISWKERLAAGLYHTGLIRVVQQVSRHAELRSSGRIPLRKPRLPKFVVLCYHRVGTGGVPLYSGLAPEIFEAQIRFLRERYRMVSLEKMHEELLNRGPAEQSVAITFDDGYRDVYNYAFPILKKYQVPSTIYLTADSIEKDEIAWYDRIFLGLDVAPGDKLDLLLDRPRRFLLPTAASRLKAAEEIISCLRTLPDTQRRVVCNEFEKLVPLPADQLTGRMLTWNQIHEMQNGGVSFGSHTFSHACLSRLDAVALDHELRQSRNFLESRLGVQVRDFAYPFGKPADYGNTSRVAAESGYRTAATTIYGFNSPGVNLHELKRVSICEERRLPTFAMRLAQLFLSADEVTPISPVLSGSQEDLVCGSN